MCVSLGTHMNETWRTYECAMTHVGVRALVQKKRENNHNNNGAGVAKYRGGVEGADALSLGTEPCVHRAFLSVSIRALLNLCQ